MSIHSIYKFLHGYPIFWAYLPDCRYCSGTGRYDGKKCTVCKGTGKRVKKDVSDIYSLEVPKDNEPKLAPDVAGYVAPDLPTWQEQRAELDWLYKGMEYAMWGTQTVEDAENRTATEVLLNKQPVNDKLNKISDSAEGMERWIMDTITSFHVKQYKGGSLHYGRRFLIEPADLVLEKLGKAIKDKLPYTTTIYYQKQYYQTEFANNMRALSLHMKLIDVEPWPFLSIQEVKDLELPALDFKRKAFYEEWRNTLTEDEILSKSVSELTKMLTKYVEDEKQGEPARSEDVPGV
jgi:hypothetical protein